jgi:FAD synthetase
MKKVLVFGVFDGIHNGHRKFLKQAKKLGDELVVVLARDEVVEELKGHKPRFDFSERSRQLFSSGIVNKVIAGDRELGTWAAAKGEQPDVIALGYDQASLKTELEKGITAFNPAPEVLVMQPHRPDKYHTSMLQKASGETTVLKKTEETLYLLALLLGSAALLLNTPSAFSFYTGFVIGEFKAWGGDLIALAYIGLGVFFIINFLKILTGSKNMNEKTALEHLRGDVRHFASEMKWGIRIAIPILLDLFLVSYLIEWVNVVNWGRLIDPLLASADRWLTGTYPFLSLEMIPFPSWLIRAVEFSFLNLAAFLVLGAIIIFFKNKKIFSKYVFAFFAGTLIMIPIWLLVPAMSPQDRFIDNVRQLPDPPAIAANLENFTPVPEVKNFLTEMRTAKAGLTDLPTTTFPSAHAAWATIAFLLLLEASPIAAALFSPFLLLSTLGTFYLAQHYFVDAPAGIIIGIIAVWLINFLFKKYYEKRDIGR